MKVECGAERRIDNKHIDNKVVVSTKHDIPFPYKMFNTDPLVQ